jgi:hypothetical protein
MLGYESTHVLDQQQAWQVEAGQTILVFDRDGEPTLRTVQSVLHKRAVVWLIVTLQGEDEQANRESAETLKITMHCPVWLAIPRQVAA